MDPHSKSNSKMAAAVHIAPSPNALHSPRADRVGTCEEIAAPALDRAADHTMHYGVGTDEEPTSPVSSTTESAEKVVAMAMAMAEEDRIVLNFGGRKFEIVRSTLQNYPDTLLGIMFHPRNHSLLRTVPGTTNEFFLDRDSDLASVILNFYRTGRVSVPPVCSLEAVKAEMDYFQIPRTYLRPDPQGEILMLTVVQQTSRFGGFVQELHICDRTGKKLVNWCPGSMEDPTVALERTQMLVDELNVLLSQGWQLKSLNSDQNGFPTSAILQRS